MTIWQRIIENWHELSWHGLFGSEPAESAVALIPEDHAPSRPPAAKQVGFTIAAIALAAKMANVDGTVSDSEIAAFHEIFQAPPEEQANVDFFFQLARRSSTGAESYARQVVRLLDGHRSVLEDLLAALFHIATADGRFDPAEDAYLSRIAAIFGFSEEEYRRLRSIELGQAPTGEATPGEDDPYLVLGLPRDADAPMIRDRWRHLVKEYHPDRAMALGVPAEFLRISNARLARINDAYRRLLPVAENGTA
jgi:DnaJ like chaperone protein